MGGLRALTLLALLAVPAGAIAQQSTLIQEGIELYDGLEYEASIERLSAALLRPGNSREDRTVINRYLALNYLTLGRQEPAEGAFRNLLVLDPDYAFDPNTTAPEIIEFFAAARERWEAEGRPGLEGAGTQRQIRINHISPAEAEKGMGIILTGTVEDPGRVSANLVLAYRTGTSGTFTRIPGTGGPEGFRATVPPDAVLPPVVEYYIEVVDAAGLPLATRGDSEAPLRIRVPDPDAGGGGVFGSWWFWAGAGVVVLGGAALGFVLLSGEEGPNGQPVDRATVVIRLVDATAGD